jgi:DNA-directed RNA polymerase specialized sigma subunit
MRNAQYLRAQAEFCLEVARQMSDDTIVENLQVEAARYQAEAVKAEHHSDPTSIDPKVPGRDVFSQKRDHHPENGFKSSKEKQAYFRLLRHLLSKKLQASFKEDQARPLPPRMADLLKKLEHP